MTKDFLNDFYGLLDRGLRTGDHTDIYEWQARYAAVELVLHDFPAEGQARIVTPGNIYAQLGCASRFYFKDPNAPADREGRQFTLAVLPADEPQDAVNEIQ